MRAVGCAPKKNERICQLAEQFPKSRSSVSSNATLHVYFHDASPAKKTTSDPSQNSAINATLYVNQFTYIWSRPKNSNSTHSGWLNSCVQSKTVSSEQEHTQCNLKSRTLLDVDTQKASPSRTKVWLKMHRDFLYEDTTFANAEDFNAGKWS